MKKELLFSITSKDFDQLNSFQKLHKDCPCGMAGEKYSYSFCPSGLGTAITVRCSCGRKLTIGNFLDYESNEQARSPVTFESLQRDNADRITSLIMNLKDSKVRKLYQTEGSLFEYLMTFFHGMAFAAIDEDTCDRIWGAEEELFRECGGDIYSRNSREAVILSKLSDDEALDRYLQIFENWECCNYNGKNDYRLMQIIESIIEFADECLQEERTPNVSGELLGCAEALTIIQEQLTDDEKKRYKLNFDIDAKYL